MVKDNQSLGEKLFDYFEDDIYDNTSKTVLSCRWCEKELNVFEAFGDRSCCLKAFLHNCVLSLRGLVYEAF